MTAAIAVLGLVVVFMLYSVVMRFVLPRTDPIREDNPTHLVGDIIQVEVRNGCGVTGIAAEATTFLRKNGFDVVEVGDHSSFDEAHTLIIDRVGDLEAAKKVARVMGVAENYVRQEIRPDYFLDVSIILGRDYASLRAFANR